MFELEIASIGSNDFEWKLQSEGRCWHFSKWRLMTDKLVIDEKSQLAGVLQSKWWIKKSDLFTLSELDCAVDNHALFHSMSTNIYAKMKP